MQAYLIDVAARQIRPIAYEYGELSRHLGGSLCIAWVYHNGDVLYVDDEALLKPAGPAAFRLRARPDGQPMMSNGVLTGRDMLDETLPPEHTVETLAAEIEWLTRDEALAWFRRQAEMPALTTRHGGGPVEVHARWDHFLRNLLGEPGGYDPRQDRDLIERL